MSDKLDFPATGRNAEPILNVLRQHLPGGDVLEVASGSGQHVVHFASHLPDNQFWPSDPDPAHVQSIAAWIAETKLGNIHPPVLLDTTDPNWMAGKPLSGLPTQLAAILCANMIHIAPIEAAIGLFAGAAKRLPENGLLLLYGPFLQTGQKDAPSNLDFDQDLKRRNPAWGVRPLPLVKNMASNAGFEFDQLIKMPANNFCVLLRRN
ncbi:MAG: SAM-dependent methyltransferase [Robiginitomaculum sp.]|nr:MAG: SAM-dependent methyltransferase [Robiginitomaculum sp.]